MHVSSTDPNNAIDRRTVAALPGSPRRLDRGALVSLILERRLTDRFAPELRRALYEALTGSRRRVTLDGGLLTVDLREPRRELAMRLRLLRRARRLVVSDPDILGGAPVFRGTRVPVEAIAAQIAQGATEAELLAGYPRLTAEMVRLAPLHAAAYPSRGRPRAQPWHDQPPRRKRRIARAEA